MIALKRPMYGPTSGKPTRGADVKIAKYGVGRYRPGILAKPKTGYTENYGLALEDAVKSLQRREGIRITGDIGKATWPVVWAHLDAYRRWQYKRFSPPTAADLAFARLLASMKAMSDHTPGYVYGGGHGTRLAELAYNRGLDCSSSTSKALYDAGLFGDEQYAWVSGQFERYGEPGAGTYFTVYANYEHVWIRLHRSQWWRFDTSPHGDGGEGPRLRYLPRLTGGFTARHYKGM